jgi:hypothetical protein
MSVEDRIAKIERHMRGMDEEINTISAMVSSSSSEEASPSRGAANPDHIWSCKKCSSRLGFYDPTTDLLRIRYKDFVTYIHIGQGGFVQVLCRSCSEMNTAEYEGSTENSSPLPELVRQSG